MQLVWGARPRGPRLTLGPNSPFGAFGCVRVRREGAPNDSRGGCAPQEFNRLIPAEKVAATILVASDGGILPPVLPPTCDWKPLHRQAGKPAATFSDTLSSRLAK